MKTDLGKLFIFLWMSVIIYFMYEIWVDIEYMTDLMHAYIKMIVQYSRH